MTHPRKDARVQLIQAALELFISQGITNTSTRQIANLAGVNEVTLFRKFRNKYGLLQAIIEESEPFNRLGELLMARLNLAGDSATGDHLRNDLAQYAHVFLDEITKIQAFTTSLIGESENYSPELKKKLGAQLNHANQVLATVIASGNESRLLSHETYAGLINQLLLGYSVTASVSQELLLWPDRKDYIQSLLNFVENYVWQTTLEQTPEQTIQSEQDSESGIQSSLLLSKPSTSGVIDLAEDEVHALLQQARKSGLVDYALAYVLFGSGLSGSEVISLCQTDRLCNDRQHILILRTEKEARQVPLNQWILGKRYGSYTSNPLTKWLNSRKDERPALFVNEDHSIMTLNSLLKRWDHWCVTLNPPKRYKLIQAQQTWRVEMLMKGMTLENLRLLTGQSVQELMPYVARAKEKSALAQAASLDRKKT